MGLIFIFGITTAMKIFFTLIFLFLFDAINAQQGFLLIQKRGKTIETYTTGANVLFYHKYNYPIQGILAHIKKDSFSVLNYAIQRRGDPRGFITFDTIYNGYSFFAATDIGFVPKKKKLRKLLNLASGASILGGGAYAVLSLVNGRRFGEDGESILKNGVIQGATLIGAGILLKKINKSEYKIGRKYTITLMPF